MCSRSGITNTRGEHTPSLRGRAKVRDSWSSRGPAWFSEPSCHARPIPKPGDAALTSELRGSVHAAALRTPAVSTPPPCGEDEGQGVMTVARLRLYFRDLPRPSDSGTRRGWSHEREEGSVHAPALRTPSVNTPPPCGGRRRPGTPDRRIGSVRISGPCHVRSQAILPSRARRGGLFTLRHYEHHF